MATVPSDIQSKLDDLLEKGEEVRLPLASDMKADTQYGARWVVLTNRRLLVEAPEGGAFASYPFKKYKDASTRSVVGGGVLTLKDGKKNVDVCRYSNSLSDNFAGLAKGFEQLSQHKALELPLDSAEIRCPTCGRLKPDRHSRCPFCIGYWQAFKRILAYLKPYKFETASVLLSTVVMSGIALVTPQVSRIIIDRVLPQGGHREWLPWLVLVLGAANAGTWLVTIFNQRQLAWLGGKLGTDLRNSVFRAVERLSLRYFDKYQVGQIMTRVGNDSAEMQQFLAEGFPFLFVNGLQFLGVLCILFTMSPVLTLAVLAPVPVMLAGQVFFWRIVRPLDHKWWNQRALLNRRLQESLAGTRVVKAFNQEKREIDRFENQNLRMFLSNYQVDKFWTLFSPTMFFLISFGMLIVWSWGGHMVVAGKLTTGDLWAFIQYLWMVYFPLQYLSQVNNWLTRAFAGAERIFETMDTVPEAYDPPDAVPLPKVRGEVEFRNVNFSYERGKPAIRNLSFKLRPGELVGLVGKSGSGKSTLLSLLNRFYVPDEGEILVDGVPLPKIPLADLRRHVGMVLQEPFLFGASLAENIAYSRPDAPMEEIVQAAKAADAHQFILGKPDAYDTRVGERGNRLSGGERQRVSIARAILHNPRILILDEATSSVDSETEAKIQEAMDRLVKHRTTLVAAHRLSTLRGADRIFVMEEGRLKEQGSHASLMRQKGAYYRLVKVQERAWKKAKKNLSLENGAGGKNEGN
jgi:ATP-binding cassette subfamily B protein